MKISSASNPAYRSLISVFLVLFCGEFAWADEVRAVPEIPFTVKPIEARTVSETARPAAETTPTAEIAPAAETSPAAVAVPAAPAMERRSTFAESTMRSTPHQTDTVQEPAVEPGTEYDTKSYPEPEAGLEQNEPERFEKVGVFVPEREDLLRAPRAAKILDLTLKAGQKVQENQILVTFDCSVLRAEIEEIRLRHEEAKVKHQSVVAARRSGEVSTDVLELAQLEVEIVLAKLNRLRKVMETCWVKAPFSGEVRKLLVHAGQTVPFLEPLLELRSARPLQFELDIPVAWRGQVEIGTEFDIKVESSPRQYQARVAALAQEVNIITQTIRVVAEVLDAEQDLTEGMSGVAVFDFAQ